MLRYFNPSSINLYASGRICFSWEPIVSSNTKINFPLYIFMYSLFKMNVRAFPIWSGPDGNGASLITTFPFSAFGSSFRPSRISRLFVWDSSFSYSVICFSIENLFTSFITSWIFGIMFLICDFSKPSVKRPARIAFWFAVPLCLIAFSRV